MMFSPTRASRRALLLVAVCLLQTSGVLSGRPHAPIPRYYHNYNHNPAANANNHNSTSSSNSSGNANHKRSISLHDRAQALSESDMKRKFFQQKKKAESEAPNQEGGGTAVPANYNHQQATTSSVVKGALNQDKAPTKATPEQAKDKNKNNDHGQRRFQTRRLKGGGGGKAEGTGKLKVKEGKVKNAKKAAKSSPIDCKEREGKKCKKKGGKYMYRKKAGIISTSYSSYSLLE